MGSIVPSDAVKIEEMLNYFNFSYDVPGEGCFSLQFASCLLSVESGAPVGGYPGLCAEGGYREQTALQPGVADRCIGLDGYAE